MERSVRHQQLLSECCWQLHTSYADIQEMNAFLMKDAPSESIADTSRSGWINEVLFTK